MTEAEWLSSLELWFLFDWVEARATPRKLRLFGCACTRRIWGMLDGKGRAVVEIAERYADGDATQCEVLEAHVATISTLRGRRPDDFAGYQAASAAMWVVDEDARDAGWNSSTSITKAVRACARLSGDQLGDVVGPEREAQAMILHDIFGNPFRPVSVDPEWRTSDVLALAQSIYEERAFERLPILADALQYAGCDSDDILTHLRGPGPHVRGCWALDLVLGKE
jgi:hypothetical protein